MAAACHVFKNTMTQTKIPIKNPTNSILTASFILIKRAAITEPIATPSATIAVSKVALSRPNDNAKAAQAITTRRKVAETESELPHALLGMQWAEKFGEKPDVCNAIGAHHDEIEMKSLLSPIVQVCDAISGARPGARRQVLDSYIQRLKDLEDIAFGFSGVQKAYAIQAGRELRVMVESAKVNDTKAAELSFNISQKIQNDMTYPGQVKVTVIRETRAVNVAK